jgi:hypothetical protein
MPPTLARDCTLALPAACPSFFGNGAPRSAGGNSDDGSDPQGPVEELRKNFDAAKVNADQ